MPEGNYFCPKCHRLGYLVKERRGNRYYYYVYHFRREGGKVKREKCYLGPVEFYDHGSLFNPIGLSGLHDKIRFLRYIEKSLEQLSIAGLPEEYIVEAYRLLDHIEKLSKELKEGVKRIIEAKKVKSEEN